MEKGRQVLYLECTGGNGPLIELRAMHVQPAESRVVVGLRPKVQAMAPCHVSLVICSWGPGDLCGLKLTEPEPKGAIKWVRKKIA